MKERIEKLCTEGSAYQKLCPCLARGVGMRVNNVMRVLTEEVDPSTLPQFCDCARVNCQMEMVYTLFSYFKIFKDVPNFQNFINSDRFSPQILEDYVIYLMGFCHEVGESREKFFEIYLYFLTQDKYVELIANSRFLYREVDFFVHILIHLDSRHIGKLLEHSDAIREVLTDILLNFPEERIVQILSRNPVIYEYSVKYLERHSSHDQVEDFVNRYRGVIDQAKKIQDVVERVKSIETDSADSSARSRRISEIIALVRSTDDFRRTIEVLAYNNVFVDEFEKDLVMNILTDSQFAHFLRDERRDSYVESRIVKKKDGFRVGSGNRVAIDPVTH